MASPLDIYMLVLPQVHLLDLAGPAQIFHGQVLNSRVVVRYISPLPCVGSRQGLTLSDLSGLPTQPIAGSWLLLIGSHRMQERLHEQACRQAVDWLREHHDQFSLIAGICSGTLLAAEAGLLQGRRCTTHHELVEVLRQLAPEAQVAQDCIFVNDGKYWSSAGITTGLDLCLHLVAQAWGYEAAMSIAREMVIYQRRSGSEPQLSFWLQHRNHVQSRVHKAQDLVMNAPGYPWRVGELAQAVNLSERHFRRQFQLATSQRIQDYLQLARVELAKRLLLQSTLSIQQVAERCGFAGERGLRRVWSRWCADSPGAFRRSGQSSGSDA